MLKLRREDRTGNMERVKMVLKLHMRNRKRFNLKLTQIFPKSQEAQLRVDNMRELWSQRPNYLRCHRWLCANSGGSSNWPGRCGRVTGAETWGNPHSTKPVLLPHLSQATTTVPSVAFHRNPGIMLDSSLSFMSPHLNNPQVLPTFSPNTSPPSLSPQLPLSSSCPNYCLGL